MTRLGINTKMALREARGGCVRALLPVIFIDSTAVFCVRLLSQNRNPFLRRSSLSGFAKC